MSSSKNPIPTNLTVEQIHRYNILCSAMTVNGGWKNKDLKQLGINTPPQSGWRKRFVMNGPDFEPETPKQSSLF